MLRFTAAFLPALLIGVAAHAASVPFTLTVTGPITLSATGASINNGSATLIVNNGSPDTGTFNASGSLTDINPNNQTVTVPFTLTLKNGNISGTMAIPVTALVSSGPVTGGSLTVTSGTGSYAGYTGTSTTATGNVANSTLTFTASGTLTTGGSTGGGGSTAPTITAVLDAASNTSNVAQGSIFIVKGSNLAPDGFIQTSFPLPTSTSNGVSINFTPAGGGSPTAAYMIYTCNTSTYGCVNDKTQLAAILPSTLAAGNYNVTVKSGTSTSAAFSATVVARKFEVFTADTTGSGLGVVQNYISASQLDLNRFTTGSIGGITTSPAKPGQPVIVWGTGMGAVTFADNTGSPGYDFSANGVSVQAVVGGVSIPVAYAGRTATLAGEDEVVFTLPSNVPTGCTVSLQISVNGTLSAPTFLAIAPDANSSACVQPGYTTAQLQDLDNGKTIASGAFSILQIQESVPTYGNVKLNSASGAFEQFSGFQLAAASQANVSVSNSGACQVITVSGTGGTLATSSNVTKLDAGSVSLNGPSGSGIANAAFTESSSLTYSLNLGFEGLPGGITIPGSLNATLVAGDYTLTGAGGKDVGNFSVKLTLGTPLTLSAPLPSTVNRSSDLSLGWTGGNSSDLVEIIGYSGTTTTSGSTSTTTATEFICTTTAGTGGFKVPASVLSQLPPTPTTANGGTGFLEVSSAPPPVPFSPDLTAGGKINSIFAAYIGTGAQVTYQ